MRDQRQTPRLCSDCRGLRRESTSSLQSPTSRAHCLAGIAPRASRGARPSTTAHSCVGDRIGCTFSVYAEIAAADSPDRCCALDAWSLLHHRVFAGKRSADDAEAAANLRPSASLSGVLMSPRRAAIGGARGFRGDTTLTIEQQPRRCIARARALDGLACAGRARLLNASRGTARKPLAARCST